MLPRNIYLSNYAMGKQCHILTETQRKKSKTLGANSSLLWCYVLFLVCVVLNGSHAGVTLPPPRRKISAASIYLCSGAHAWRDLST